MTTVSSRDFNRNVDVAKKAADHGPVVITERGRPAYVMLTLDAYKRLTGTRQTLDEMLFMPGIAEVDLDLPSRNDMGRADFD